LLNKRHRINRYLFSVIVMAAFVAGSLVSPQQAKSARSVSPKSVKSTLIAAKPMTPPPAPVGMKALTEAIGVGDEMRCGGKGCASEFLVCTAAGSHLLALSGCCAKCCWDNDPNNCSEQTCCTSTVVVADAAVAAD
jgi:hypothetical protein